MVDRDSIEGKTNKTVKASSNEGNSGLSGNFSEDLVLNGHTTDVDIILGEETRDSAAAVFDFELLTILLQGVRCGDIAKKGAEMINCVQGGTL